MERGNAPAEFVLVSVLLVALVLGSVQIVIIGYVRHALTSAAAEGARAGSLVDAQISEATSRTRTLIHSSLSPAYSQQVRATVTNSLGVPTLEVSVSAPFPALGLWSAGGVMEVSAHAPVEYAR
jgi:Flp pilus assembly protein TadG